MTLYRYTIQLDRDGAAEDYGPEATADHDNDKGSHHDGSNEAAIAQVARELQEAMDATGLPVGTFLIVKREKVEADDETTILTCDVAGCTITGEPGGPQTHCAECGNCLDHCEDRAGHERAVLIGSGFSEEDADEMVRSDDWMATPDQLAIRQELPNGVVIERRPEPGRFEVEDRPMTTRIRIVVEEERGPIEPTPDEVQAFGDVRRPSRQSAPRMGSHPRPCIDRGVNQLCHPLARL